LSKFDANAANVDQGSLASLHRDATTVKITAANNLKTPLDELLKMAEDATFLNGKSVTEANPLLWI